MIINMKMNMKKFLIVLIFALLFSCKNKSFNKDDLKIYVEQRKENNEYEVKDNIERDSKTVLYDKNKNIIFESSADTIEVVSDMVTGKVIYFNELIYSSDGIWNQLYSIDGEKIDSKYFNDYLSDIYILNQFLIAQNNMYEWEVYDISNIYKPAFTGICSDNINIINGYIFVSYDKYYDSDGRIKRLEIFDTNFDLIKIVYDYNYLECYTDGKNKYYKLENNRFVDRNYIEEYNYLDENFNLLFEKIIE